MTTNCELCGHSMPKGEEMFKFHGFSGPCPVPVVHVVVEPDHSPKDARELVDYLRTMACVDPESGRRRMPRPVDDEVFERAANLIEASYLEKTT